MRVKLLSVWAIEHNSHYFSASISALVAHYTVNSTNNTLVFLKLKYVLTEWVSLFSMTRSRQELFPLACYKISAFNKMACSVSMQILDEWPSKHLTTSSKVWSQLLLMGDFYGQQEHNAEYNTPEAMICQILSLIPSLVCKIQLYQTIHTCLTDWRNPRASDFMWLELAGSVGQALHMNCHVYFLLGLTTCQL